jgi:hypothetical protein
MTLAEGEKIKGKVTDECFNSGFGLFRLSSVFPGKIIPIPLTFLHRAQFPSL